MELQIKKQRPLILLVLEDDRRLPPGGRSCRRDYQREQYLNRKAATLDGVRAYDRQRRYLKRKAQQQASDVSCASKESSPGIICEPVLAGQAGINCAGPKVGPCIGVPWNCLDPGCLLASTCPSLWSYLWLARLPDWKTLGEPARFCITGVGWSSETRAFRMMIYF